jgi:hypothetical protein
VAPHFDAQALEAIFQHKVFKILLKKGVIARKRIAMMQAWRHFRV